ncbi:hypothetical protein FOZ62_008778, partial [Perkinsus olseni]
ASWLSRELQGVLSDESYGDQRTPAIADMLAAHGLSEVVASWFNEKYWPALNAWRCVSECKNVQALRCAALEHQVDMPCTVTVDDGASWASGLSKQVSGGTSPMCLGSLYVCHEAASTKSQVEQLRKTLRDAKMESRGLIIVMTSATGKQHLASKGDALPTGAALESSDSTNRLFTPKFVALQLWHRVCR